jgi:hypothetical protein
MAHLTPRFLSLPPPAPAPISISLRLNHDRNFMVSTELQTTLHVKISKPLPLHTQPPLDDPTNPDPSHPSYPPPFSSPSSTQNTSDKPFPPPSPRNSPNPSKKSLLSEALGERFKNPLGDLMPRAIPQERGFRFGGARVGGRAPYRREMIRVSIRV